MDRDKLQLEIHIPRFGYQPLSGLRQAYVKALCAELTAAAEELAEYEIASISLSQATELNEAGLEEVFLTLRKTVDLSRAAKTVTVAPEKLSTANMTAFRNARIDHYRIDFGALNYVDFRTLNRPYDFRVHGSVRELLSQYDMHNFMVILYVGLPGQKSVSLQDSIQRALEMESEGVSLMVVDNRDAAGGEAKELLEFGVRFLEQAGYEQGNYDQTAQGRLSSYDFVRGGASSCSVDTDKKPATIWGIGCGAITQIDGIRMQNTTDVDRYIQYAGDVEKTASYLGNEL